MINLSERLRELRAKFGYTQSQVAKLLNIDRSTYAYYETGKTRPDVFSLQLLSRVFNISIDELLADETSPKSMKDSGIPSDYVRGKKNSSHIFELAPEEKELLGAFRVCSPGEKKAIMDYAINLIHGHNRKEVSDR